MIENNKKRFFSIIILVLIFIVVLCISSKIIPLYDDIVYQFEYKINENMPEVLTVDFNKKISTFPQIINSQVKEYFNWNSRSLINIVVSSISSFNFGYFKYINATFFIILLLTISYICCGSFDNPIIFLLSFFLLIIFSSNIKQQVFYTLFCAAHYLWIHTLTLVFLTPFFDDLKGKKSKVWDNKLLTALWCILGFIVGWGTNISCLMALGFILIVVCKKLIKKEKISIKTIICISFYIVGFLFLWASPSNSNRMAAMGNGVDIKTSFSEIFDLMFLYNYNFQALFYICSAFLVKKYNKKLFYITLLLYIPLVFLLITRNSFIWVELPEKYISLIYPTLISNIPSYYTSVSWNLQYYFYGFYMILTSFIYMYLFVKNKNNSLICLLYFAGLCGNLTRLSSPIGSERTCFYSDVMYLIIIVYVLSTTKLNKSNIIKLCLFISILFISINDYFIYYHDYNTYLKRKDLITEYIHKNDNSILILPRYSYNGYYVYQHPNSNNLSAHTKILLDSLHIDAENVYEVAFEQN